MRCAMCAAGTVNVLCLSAALAAGRGGLHKMHRGASADAMRRGLPFSHLGGSGRAGGARSQDVDEREFERDQQAARRRKNVKFYNRLITKYSKLHAAAQAQQLFDDLAIPPPRVALRAQASRHALPAHHNSEGMVAANDFSWSCLMNAYARRGRARGGGVWKVVCE